MEIKSIDSKTLGSWLKNDLAILIDVREVYENNAARIKDSILIPLGEIDINTIPISNNKKLVVYCKAGVRSQGAISILLAQNPNLDIYNLEGGIESWRAFGGDIIVNS